jgi:hypothetical protein
MALGATNMSMNLSSFTANKSNPSATTSLSLLHTAEQMTACYNQFLAFKVNKK